MIVKCANCHKELNLTNANPNSNYVCNDCAAILPKCRVCGKILLNYISGDKICAICAARKIKKVCIIASIIILIALPISLGLFSSHKSSYNDIYQNYSSGTNTKSSSYSSISFTNKYGTATTICAHTGCTNYIASSGDTNCCTTHSARCLNCRKYIDEDAMYCMDCLSNTIFNSK